MFGWLFALVYAVVLLAFFNWWDQNFPRRWRYSNTRKWRASRLWLFTKACLIVAVPVYPLAWLIGFEFESFILGIVGGVGFLVAVCWTGCRIAGAALFGNDPEYQALLKDGWSPFWGTFIPGVVNRDPPEVQAGKPPAILLGSNWQPPRSWTERCPNCGRAQPESMFWCWFCGLGFEHGRQKMCCPDCDTTFCESAPGRSEVMPVECPGCGRAWWFPQRDSNS